MDFHDNHFLQNQKKKTNKKKYNHFWSQAQLYYTDWKMR